MNELTDKELPAGWAWARLDEIVDVLDHQRVPVSATERAQRPGTVPYYGAAGQVGWIDTALFNEELILLGEDGVQFFDSNKPKAYRVSGPVWVNNHAHVLRARKEATLARFITHYLNKFNYEGYANGTTRLKLTKSSMCSIPVPLPPLAEQYRIVETLEGHLSRLDIADMDLHKSIARMPALRGGMRNAVTHFQKPDHTLPDGWSWGNLADILVRIEAGKSFRCEARPATEVEWGVIKVSAMTWGEFRPEEQKAVPAGKKIDPRHEIESGDILISRANTPAYVGAPVLVKKCRPRLLLSDKSLRLVPHPWVDRTWLIQTLSSPYVRNQISAVATGTKDSMRNISQRNLLDVRIPIPHADTQILIGQTLETAVERIDSLTSGLSLARIRAKHLRQALLNHAFTGQLVSQAPSDEPASILLNRIRSEYEATGGKIKRTTRGASKTSGSTDALLSHSATSPMTTVQQELTL